MKQYFITAIDTDAGKSFVTGLMASFFMKRGFSITTQKFVQTGCKGPIAEDIITHRKLMGIEPTPEDLQGLTCPNIFQFPSSPHLAASLENRKVDIPGIKDASKKLSSIYEILLIEGAGGLAVPIDGTYTTLDYLEETGIPIMLVTSPKLGSINHTLLSLEALSRRGLYLSALIYNSYPKGEPLIKEDSLKVFRLFLKKYNFPENIIEVPLIDESATIEVDFSTIL